MARRRKDAVERASRHRVVDHERDSRAGFRGGGGESRARPRARDATQASLGLEEHQRWGEAGERKTLGLLVEVFFFFQSGNSTFAAMAKGIESHSETTLGTRQKEFHLQTPLYNNSAPSLPLGAHPVLRPRPPPLALPWLAWWHLLIITRQAGGKWTGP